MNVQTSVTAAPAVFKKPDPNLPALIMTDALYVRRGVEFAGWSFDINALVEMPAALVAGRDYGVFVENGRPIASAMDSEIVAGNQLGGFHFAPGGNASARGGGGEVAAINPHSLWDRNFRPACVDPRGMTLVEGPRGKFWCDIYLLGVNHLAKGTSRLGETIADGDDPPMANERAFDRLDYETAVKVMTHHGKELLAFDEFAAAAYGVTEKSSCSRDPKVTKLDAARTSKWGVMQATGNLWVWGHDGDPDEPRPSIFGGSWFDDRRAGSRDAYLGYWPGYSGGNLGARGRSDHLQPA